MGSILFRASKDGMLAGEKYLTHACMLLRKSKRDLPVTGDPRKLKAVKAAFFVA